MTSHNPICPGCGGQVTSISYNKNFIFVDGIRHSAGWVWELHCCGAILLDESLDWVVDYEKEVSGLVPVHLLDRGNGETALEWIDQLPQGEETDSHG